MDDVAEIAIEIEAVAVVVRIAGHRQTARAGEHGAVQPAACCDIGKHVAGAQAWIHLEQERFIRRKCLNGYRTVDAAPGKHLKGPDRQGVDFRRADGMRLHHLSAEHLVADPRHADRGNPVGRDVAVDAQFRRRDELLENQVAPRCADATGIGR